MNRTTMYGALALLAVAGLAGLAHAESWSHGFESADTPGAPDYGWDHDPYSYVFGETPANAGPVARVASAPNAAGTGTVTPQSGAYMGAFGTTNNNTVAGHPFPPVAKVGPATSFGALEFSGSWPTAVPGIESYIDVYLDTGWKDGSGFDYSVAISAAGTPAQHQRDFMFNVYKGVDAASDVLYVAGSNNTSYKPLDISSIGYAITASGWYRFDYDFKEVGESDTTAGYLEVTMRLLPGGGGDALETWTRSNPADIIDSDGSGGIEARTVGGRNYGWFPYIDLADADGTAMALYTDNVRYENPEPTTLALCALGGLALLRRRRPARA